ncbi:hypothetical protein A8F94_03590 [Bacillus sp. FJAT-27225]|uniref:helix-turn-helix domain-containing protein n=1 Tax=Bacillus sp. FJAT-27225 TaxID=1743144 RepID=UPI00080C244B|nr:helix-turn-helix domain-containing protein [Bacillus sp. FJAT-27225]OCA90965.1 hypothetical protein A8F94_03590 [Bacillus sp. FJAT-27225]
MQQLRYTNQLSYLEMLILFCLKQLNGERSIYSIYHLLNGKKSAQTIQDAHLFELTRFFRVYESLSRELLEDIVKILASKGLIESGNPAHYFVTVKGNALLTEALEVHPFPNHLSGLRFSQLSQILWERLSLLVQVCSHFTYKENSYVPIQKGRQTQLWVKAFFSKRDSAEKTKIPYLIYRELMEVLDNKGIPIPDILVLRLSGYKHIGMTTGQAASRLGMDEVHYRVEFQGILHYICETVITNGARFPILYELVRDGSKSSALTLTSRQTMKLLHQGYSIEDISMFRNLKISTIEDHIVEIALNCPDFSIDPFVRAEEQQMIAELAEKTSSKQLRHLRDLLGGMDYFKIRLVLAKLGDSNVGTKII